MKKPKTAILVIDDEPSILGSLYGILTDEGYRVFTSESGLNGLNILLKKEIDIVLLDVWMPEMDGIETLAKIKEKHPEVKVILVSGHGTEETVAEALQLGASDFLEKPLSLEKLLDSIEGVEEKIETKVIQVKSGKTISAAFHETICIYPEKKDLLLYLRRFCSERFFKVVVATDWTDILACPSFVTIIDPSKVKKRDWSALFNYLSDAPDTWECFVLSSKTRQLKIPKSLNKFFKTIKDRSILGEYILRCNKEAVRRMTRQQKSAFIDQRRKDVQKIVSKRDLQREFFVGKLAKYYNVSTRTIKRD